MNTSLFGKTPEHQFLPRLITDINTFCYIKEDIFRFIFVFCTVTCLHALMFKKLFEGGECVGEKLWELLAFTDHVHAHTPI